MGTSWALWAAAVVGQAITQVDAGNGAAGVEVDSLWDFLVKGGPVIIPIGLCSLAALTVAVERLATLRRRRIVPDGFMDGLKTILKDGIHDRDEALQYCQEDGSPIARIVGVGIRHLDAPIDRLESKIEEAGKREVVHLQKHLRVLSVIASIAPLLGLLGTIFGMIDAFQTVAVSGEALGKTELLARGIYQAMITTAAGLCVAIPVLIAYHWFSAKIGAIVAEMDAMTVAFVEQFAPQAGRVVAAKSLIEPASGTEGKEATLTPTNSPGQVALA